MKYFGTDGIRGIPGESLPFDLINRIGKSLFILENKVVLIGCDTRVSCQKIIDCLIEGINTSGLDIYLLGVIPTPILLYESKIQNAIGVMITASHNPYYDNGVKIVLNGEKLTDDQQKSIEYLIDNPIDLELKSNIYKNECVFSDYISFLDRYIDKYNYNIAIDCANGATYKIAPSIFSKITNHLEIMSTSPDGYNINNNCGSTHPEMLKEVVLKNCCDIGFSFDGDGDRVIAIDSKGRIINGDLIIYVIALYLKKINKLKNNCVVLTIMSNPGIINALNKEGIKTIEANVGDRNVIEKMNQYNASLGGENSGHIIMNDYFHSGDGILTAIIFLKAIKYLNINFVDLLDNIKLYYDKMINIKKDDKDVINSELINNLVNQAYNDLGFGSKIIIRPSGTENLIRVSVMGQDEKLVDYYCNLISNSILKN